MIMSIFYYRPLPLSSWTSIAESRASLFPSPSLSNHALGCGLPLFYPSTNTSSPLGELGGRCVPLWTQIESRLCSFWLSSYVATSLMLWALNPSALSNSQSSHYRKVFLHWGNPLPQNSPHFVAKSRIRKCSVLASDIADTGTFLARLLWPLCSL